MIKNILVLLIGIFVYITPLQAMEEFAAIALVQPDGKKMLVKIKLHQSLSNLRSELISAGKITSDDIFQKEDCDIFREDEKDWTVREVLVNNSLFLKSKNSISSPPLKNIENQTPPKLVVVVASKKEIVLGEGDELREKQKIFSIWGSDIDTSLTHFKYLLNHDGYHYSMNYDTLMNILTELINLYSVRREIASRYLYSSNGISAYAEKVIESHKITIQSISKTIEGFMKIKNEEVNKKETKEEEHRIHHIRTGYLYRNAPMSYTFISQIPYILTLALLHNQLLDELYLYANLFGSEHPLTNDFVEIICKCPFSFITPEECIGKPIDGQQLYATLQEKTNKEAAEKQANERAKQANERFSQIITMQENDHSKCTYDSEQKKHICLIADAAYKYKGGYQNKTAREEYKKELRKCPKNPEKSCIVQ